MSLKKIIVANWKLERNFAQAHEWVKAHRSDLSELASQVQLIICPDIVTTASLEHLLQGTGVLLGAQDCSPYLSGRHTGAVSAQSLRETGCSYTLIGHSEQRLQSTLTPADYALACGMALQCGITPILCVGESVEDCRSHLEPLYSNTPLYIAYEPLWAIGSGNSASSVEIAQRIEWLRAITDNPAIRILYGGGVTPENGISLGKIPHLDGLLVGSSSLDMQSLKKIVYSFIK